MTSRDLVRLVELDRLCPVLIRCGGCRFTCAAQDAAHLMACVKAGGDYVRDVSFPVGSDKRAAAWVHPHCPVTSLSLVSEEFTKPLPALRRVEIRPIRLSDTMPFDESECGGAFDGTQVTSDADSGL